LDTQSRLVVYDAAGNLVATNLYGDLDCDGDVDFDDLDAFVLALTDPPGYAAAYPNCNALLGDVNGDGLVNFNDVNAFVTLLDGAGVEPRRYEYDEENRLTAVKQHDGTPLLELAYDALGRRVESADYTCGTGIVPVSLCDPCGGGTGIAPLLTRHVYSGLETIQEYVCCGTGVPACSGAEDWFLAREFVWGDRFPEPVALIDYTELGNAPLGTPEVLHYVQDALGSVAGLTDAGDPSANPPVPAKQVERYVYDPYGRTYVETWDASLNGGAGGWTRPATSFYGNPFGWTGQRYDTGVGLYHFYARTYSPELGRWLQRDPLGFVDGVNTYEYVSSMPTRFVDPYGLAAAMGDGGGSDGGGGDPPGPPGNDGPTPSGGCGDGDGEGGGESQPGGQGGGTGGSQSKGGGKKQEPPRPDRNLLDWIKKHYPQYYREYQGIAETDDPAALLQWINRLIAQIQYDIDRARQQAEAAAREFLEQASARQTALEQTREGLEEDVQAIRSQAIALVEMYHNTAGLGDAVLAETAYVIGGTIGGVIAETSLAITGFGWLHSTDKYQTGTIMTRIYEQVPKIWDALAPEWAGGGGLHPR
jgi:RHS repeat-associated protein